MNMQKLTPIEAAVRYGQQIGYQTVHEIHLRVTSGVGVQRTRPDRYMLLEQSPQTVDSQIGRTDELQPPRALAILVVHLGAQHLHPPDLSETGRHLYALFHLAGTLHPSLFVAVLVYRTNAAGKKFVRDISVLE